MWSVDSLEKTLMLRKLRAGGERVTEDDGWMPSPTHWTWVWANARREWRTGKPGVLQSMGSQSWTRFSSWTTILRFILFISYNSLIRTLLSKFTIWNILSIQTSYIHIQNCLHVLALLKHLIILRSFKKI